MSEMGENGFSFRSIVVNQDANQRLVLGDEGRKSFSLFGVILLPPDIGIIYLASIKGC